MAKGTAVFRNGRQNIVKSFKMFALSVCSLTLAFIAFFFTPGMSDAASTQIEVNARTNYLYLYQNGVVVKTYRVATGTTSTPTPKGVFSVGFKTTCPGWKGIAGCTSGNPLGPRWIGLTVNGDNARTYGIHGTNNPDSIGTNASNGCIRMYNADVIALYDKVPLGTKVWIHTGTSTGVWNGGSTGGETIKASSGQVKVITSNGSLNVRSAPSSTASIITTVAKGTILTKTGESTNWVRIKLSNGTTGYVSKQYVQNVTSSGDSSNDSGGTVSNSPGQVKVVISNGSLNIRSAPSTTSTVLQTVPNGFILNKVSVSGDWVKIVLKSGAYAYVSKAYVRDI